MALSSSSHLDQTLQERWSDMVFRALYPTEDALFPEFGNEFLPEFSFEPDIVDSIPSFSYDYDYDYDFVYSEDIWNLPKPSNNSYSCNFPLQDTQLSHQDITSDENVYIHDTGITNITCDAGSSKLAAEGGSNKPAADVGSIKDSCCACYMYGEALHFAKKCSLGCDSGNSTT